MSYQTLIDSFQSVLNRDDCTTAKADGFIQQGIRRLQREVRLPCMEREMATIVTNSGTSSVFVPTDLLSIQDVLVSDTNTPTPRPLKKIGYRELVLVNPTTPPSVYARLRGQIGIAGSLNQGAIVRVLYYGTFSNLESFAAENEVTAGFPDVAMYAGLVFAASSFTHPSKGSWETDYQTLKTALIDEAVELEMTGGPQAITPLYSEGF